VPGDFGKGITMPILKDKFGGMFCDDQSHISSLNAFVSDISHACLSAGGASLPYTGVVVLGVVFLDGLNLLPLPGIGPLCGIKSGPSLRRQRTGVVADIIRKTRAAYHYTIRRVRRDADNIVNERFAEALSNNNGREFWAEVKKIRGNKACVSSVVDGVCTPDGTADLFK